MAHQCDICGKGPVVGNQVTIRGKAKYLGGVGTKVTGINRRQFKPNLQKVRITVGGTNKSIFACTQCLRSGAVVKRVRATPFRLPGDVRSQKAAGKKAAAAKKTAAGKKTEVAKKK